MIYGTPRRELLSRLSSAEVSELIAADNVGLIPESPLRPTHEPQDMQATYEARRAMYDANGHNRR